MLRYWSIACVAVLACGGLLAAGCSPAAPPAPPPAVANPPVTDGPAEGAPDEPAADAKVPASTTNAATTDTSATTTSTTDGPASERVMLGSADLTAGIPGEGPLKLPEIQAWLDDPRNHAEFEIDLPQGLNTGLQQVKGLDQNKLTRAKIELGRQLYFDKRLSVDSTVSCSSCHDPDQGYAAHTQFGVGVRGQMGGRNSPVSYNRILSDKQFWDGRAASLEEQAIGPIANPIEMGYTHEACVECLAGIEGYKIQFEKIFGGVTIENVGKALASFERAIVTGPAPFDFNEQFRLYADADLDELKEEDPEGYATYEKIKAGAEAHPMSESALRGRELFFTDKASCTACHVGPNLADELYHNLGIGMEAPMPDLGRYEVTKEEKDRGAFKTPTIRNVALSATYMHDGSLKTLEEVVKWYAKGGHPNEHLSQKIKKLTLTDQDQADLVAFMEACTGPFPQVTRDRLPAEKGN